MAKKTMKKAAPAKAMPAKAMPAKIVKLRRASAPRNASTMSYTFSEFIENLRAFTGLTKRSQAKELCEDVALLIKDTLKRGIKIPVFGLGKMYVRRTKARTGRNPATGEAIAIPSRKKVRFTPAKSLKEAVL